MSAALTYPNHGTNSVTSSPRGSLEYKSRISKKGNLKKSSCVETRSVDYGFSLETLEMTDLSKPSSYPFLHHEQEDENEGDRITEARQNQPALQTHNECFMLYTPDEEERVIKIFDRRLVLFVALLYMLSFLDRSNIGNAKIAGLSHDLNLTSSQYEWLLRAFYITYILFEWMALMYQVVPPHMYITLCVASWGLLASLQSVVTSFNSLLVLRALLGVSEAAFGPGVPFYLSFFYKRDELALRTGLFISAAPLATSFASSLAWAITKAGESIPIASWRMLFLVEGFPSVIVAVFAWHLIPDSPGTTKYLTRRLRDVAVLRLQKAEHTGTIEPKTRVLRWKEIWNTLIDPKCYLTAAMFFCCNVAFSSLPVFLPTIIEEMGHSALTSQALSAPPYLVAFLTVVLTARLSDHYRTRSLFIICHATLAATGYAVIAIAGALQASPAWRYAGIFPTTMGFFSAITIIITWTINNQDSASKKGTGVAMLNFIGQLGPLVGVQLYPASDGPFYVRGMAVCATFMAAAAALAWGLRRLLAAKNRRVKHNYEPVGMEDEGLNEGLDGKKEMPFQFML